MNLRQELKTLGFTAPKNMSEAQMQAKLDELKAQQSLDADQDEPESEKQSEVGPGVDGDTDSDQPEHESDESDESDDGLVEVISKTGFTNASKKVSAKAAGEKLRVSPELAEWLVEEDRTCSYA